MKPYEQFVDNILGAVRSGQGKDPAAATALIQDALRNAGLMPGAQPGMRAPFADLNHGDWREHFKARHTRPHKPSTPDAPGQFLAGSFGNGAGTRRYRVYVPARAASGPRPLVVMLHGCQQDAGDFGMQFAEKYFSTVRAAVKKVAPNNLYLGCRFNDL